MRNVRPDGGGAERAGERGESNLEQRVFTPHYFMNAAWIAEQ